MLKNTISWLCIFSVLLLPSISSADVLLCLGDDGHMSVEKSYLGSCDAHEVNGSIDSTDAPYSNISEAHCGPCTDLPFLQNSLEGLSLEKYTPENKLRFSNLSLIPNSLRLTAERKVEVVHTPVLTTLFPATSLLKTVVLII